MIVFIISLVFSLTTDVHSDNGMFHGVVRYSGGADLFTESFVLYDQYGDIIYEKRDISLNTFFIGNTGGVFALNEYHLYLYQQDGSEKMLRELVYPNGFGFSPDGSLFFASDREGIFAYSHDGMLSHAYCPGRLFASNGGGESVAIISTDTLFVYCSGTVIDTEILSSPYARDVHFSSDDGSVVVEIEDHVEVYDMRTHSWIKRK